MDPKEFQKAYGKLVAKAWSDAEFKAKLLADPMKVFKENSMEVPEGIEVRIVENTDKIINFILPPEPSDELTDEQLSGADGGFVCFSSCTYACYHRNTIY
ncbi:MAG: hypothetical protein A2283_10990 [Lentisphaerae bacterium RIFOXYA12_FULL_48_11]|nr:MAG: hypothetical protein A2283_10990 [Lentisphaerae bacterium RIFOXYA12_FULL_48_11]